MVSAGTLRLLSELADGGVAGFEPTIDERAGEVRYPDAERIVDERDRPAYATLEALARRGVLRRTFREKVYVCPDCDARGLRYTTVCSTCGSEHTVETDLLVHGDCGEDSPRDRFEDPDVDGYVCPRCEERVEAIRGMESRREHVCRDCGEREPRPAHGLRCDACAVVHDPAAAVELPLYRYDLGTDGEAWVERQRAARRTTADELEGRGYDVAVDAAVEADGGGGEAHPVHLRATDELLGDAVVADVHERPNRDDAERLRAAAALVGGRGVLVTTSGEITEGAAAVARADGLRVLNYRGGARLDGSYETTEGREESTVLKRITAGVRRRLE